MNIRKWAIAFHTSLCLGVSANAAAQVATDFPSKPVTIVVPYAAGGATDVIARLVGQKLSEAWKQPVIVNNRPGAGTVLGAGQVAKATGDGYTLYMTTAAHTISASLYKSLPYDPIKDFAPINLASVVPLVLVASPSVPAADLKEFLALARSKPGMTYASPGNGSPQHLAGAQLKASAKLELVHVPYKGDAPMLSDLVGGQVQFAFVTLSSALPHIKTGKLRAIALAHHKRTDALPNVPTFSQAGMQGFSAATWFGLFGPASIPSGLQQKIYTDVSKAIASADLNAKLVEMGGEVVNSGPKEFSEFVRNEAKVWAEAVKLSGAQVD